MRLGKEETAKEIEKEPLLRLEKNQEAGILEAKYLRK